MAMTQHAAASVSILQHLQNCKGNLVLDGTSLSIPDVYYVVKNSQGLQVAVDANALSNTKTNSDYLQRKVSTGLVIYGINTGFGGSADVRSSKIEKVQQALIQHLNAGFGETFSCDIVRGVMLVRANSLSRAMSGARPAVIQILAEMINRDIVPLVPLRGSVSASGDLMPTSYIAAAMTGRPDCKVLHKGHLTTADKALKAAKLTPIVFQAKEALAVLNSTSFASALGSCVALEANTCLLLTQLATAMSVEALNGRTESFHPTIHHSMPHPGQVEVAHNISQILSGTKMAISGLDTERKDTDGELKQDRYPLRTAAQWLGPAAETLQETMRRLVVEINSTSDNPIIDHRKDRILHGGNFQGTSVTVAMDQCRQSLQLCGKLLFAQMSEIINHKMNGRLPPNLCGSDVTVDFGFKGTDTAMASYMSELDWLTPPLTNHVLSAEMHNQAVNSLALISARQSRTALTILQMMLTNITLAQCQAIDLSWLQSQVQATLQSVLLQHKIPAKFQHHDVFPWYNFIFNTSSTVKSFLEYVSHIPLNEDAFLTSISSAMDTLRSTITSGQHVPHVASQLGAGTRVLYKFVRQNLGITFNDGQRPLDTDLQTLFRTFENHKLDEVVLEAFQFINPDTGLVLPSIPLSRL